MSETHCPHGLRDLRHGYTREGRLGAGQLCLKGLCQPAWLSPRELREIAFAFARWEDAERDWESRIDALAAKRDRAAEQMAA